MELNRIPSIQLSFTSTLFSTGIEYTFEKWEAMVILMPWVYSRWPSPKEKVR
jgi:hypothetical protein